MAAHPTASVDDCMSRLVALLHAERHSEMEHLARELLRSQPQSATAWQWLGVALSKQGKDAAPALRRAVEILPNDPIIHLNLGNAFGRLGQLQEARACFERAVFILPEFAEAHNNLGDVWLELGQFNEALLSCRRALLIRPQFAEAHQNLAKTQLRLGQYQDAADSCRRALEIHAEFADAHNTLGNAWIKLARVEQGIASFNRALTINPDFAEAWLNLANARRSIGLLEDAVVGYRRAIQIDSTLLAAFTELGTTLRLQRRGEAAEAICREALRIDPASVETLAVLAELQADRGHFTQAEEIFKRILSIDTQSAEAWAGITRMRRMTAGDGAWLCAAQPLAERGLVPQREMVLRYAIGKYFDDIADFANAFENYQRANQLAKHSGPAYDRELLTRTIDLIIRSHDPQWMNRQRRTPDLSMRPVFIVGMLRSGTSLTEQILASHEAVYGAGELMFWGAQGASIAADAKANASRIDIPDLELVRLGEDYLGLLRSVSSGLSTVVDKMPTNFLFLGLIRAALPHARFIHMRRHPIDTCLSIFFQHFEAANTYANDLQDLAHYYGQYRRLMQHWREVLPPECLLDVPYEGLVEDPSAWTRRMLAFIGLPWNARCLDFDQLNRPVVTASKWQVRQKISRSSVGRWRHYEAFLSPLKDLDEHSV
jgi:tetratricopeptide (TPR) repeat protein